MWKAKFTKKEQKGDKKITEGAKRAIRDILYILSYGTLCPFLALFARPVIFLLPSSFLVQKKEKD